MQEPPQPRAIHRKLVDALYTEAMVLADEARGYFDADSRVDRAALDPFARVAFSCESLKVTTRLMQVIAWLLTQRAVQAGEISVRDSLAPARRLGLAPDTADEALGRMPGQGAEIVRSSIDLYRRVARLDASFDAPAGGAGPARTMLDRLSAAF